MRTSFLAASSTSSLLRRGIDGTRHIPPTGPLARECTQNHQANPIRGDLLLHELNPDRSSNTCQSASLRSGIRTYWAAQECYSSHVCITKLIACSQCSKQGQARRSVLSPITQEPLLCSGIWHSCLAILHALLQCLQCLHGRLHSHLSRSEACSSGHPSLELHYGSILIACNPHGPHRKVGAQIRHM